MHMELEIPTVESPCVQNCCLDENDVCMGCFRSLSEITAWGMVNDQQRRKILENTEKRRKIRELKFDR